MKKKKKKKKSSENDQSTGHFQSFFSSLFSRPPTMNLKKKSCNSTNNKIWPKLTNWTTGVTSWFHFWKYIYHIFKICI